MRVRKVSLLCNENIWTGNVHFERPEQSGCYVVAMNVHSYSSRRQLCRFVFSKCKSKPSASFQLISRPFLPFRFPRSKVNRMLNASQHLSAVAACSLVRTQHFRDNSFVCHANEMNERIRSLFLERKSFFTFFFASVGFEQVKFSGALLFAIDADAFVFLFLLFFCSRNSNLQLQKSIATETENRMHKWVRVSERAREEKSKKAKNGKVRNLIAATRRLCNFFKYPVRSLTFSHSMCVFHIHFQLASAHRQRYFEMSTVERRIKEFFFFHFFQCFFLPSFRNSSDVSLPLLHREIMCKSSSTETTTKEKEERREENCLKMLILCLLFRFFVSVCVCYVDKAATE